MILNTDQRCEIGGNAYVGIPVILDEEAGALYEAPTDFLRIRRIDEGKSILTVQGDAIMLRLWLRYLKHKKVRWQDATDNLLRSWRDALCRGGEKPWHRSTQNAGRGRYSTASKKVKLRGIRGWKKATVNQYVELVFTFYEMAERQGWVKGLVRIDDSDPRRKYPLSSKRNKSGRYVTTLSYATTQEANRHTPTEEEIQRLHEAAAPADRTKRNQGNRNTLIMSWYEETGLRRAGALRQLTLNKIPTSDVIFEHFQRDEDFEIQVTEKGDKSRSVCVTPMLMETTRDYILEERDAIVKRWNKRPGWREPNVVFLSERGTPLSLKGFSNVMTRVFRVAKVKNASGHRLRARYLVRLFECFLDEKDSNGKAFDHATVLLRVARIAGHSNLESLRPYLNFVLKKRLFMSKQERDRKDAQKAREATRRAEQWVQRAKDAKSATELLRALHTHDKAAFVEIAARMANEINRD